MRRECASILFIPPRETASATETPKALRSKPTSRTQLVLHGTLAALAMLLTSGTQPNTDKPTSVSILGSNGEGANGMTVSSTEAMWQKELETAVDECLEACDLNSVFAATAAYAARKEDEEIDLHALTKNASPRLQAALQNLSDILKNKPMLTERARESLREKLHRLNRTDYRRLMGTMIPPAGDAMLPEPNRVTRICEKYLENAETGNLVSYQTTERVRSRNSRATETLITEH